MPIKKLLIQNWWQVLVIMFTASLYALASVASASYYGYIVEHASNQNQALFIMMIITGLTVVLLKWVFDLVNQLTMVKFVGQIIYKIRKDMLQALTKKSVDQFSQKKVSTYTSNLLNDVELVDRDAIEPFFDIISQSVVVLVSSITILYYQPTVFVVIVVGAIVVFLIPTLMSKTLQKKQSQFSKHSEELTESATDILNGFETIKTTKSTNHFLTHFDQNNQNYTKTKISSGKWIMANFVTSSMLGMLIQYAAVLTSIWFIMNGMITVGIMLTMVQTMNTLVFPLIDIFRLVPQINSSKPIIQKINNLATSNNEKEVDETEFKHTVKVSNLSYTIKNKPILTDISLILEKNKKYLLVGESGSGKSTLARIFAGLNHEFAGRLTVDDSNIENTESLFDISSYVSQSPYLFNQTIKDNILMNQPLDDELLTKVLQNSCVNQFITREDLNDLSNQNGSNYSGGQRQRIAIARGLYQQKPLLILDESLSGLNAKLAHQIEQQLLTLEGTLLSITHKFDFDLINKYDEIIWIQKGKLIEKDTPQQLLKNEEFQYFLNLSQNEFKS